MYYLSYINNKFFWLKLSATGITHFVDHLGQVPAVAEQGEILQVLSQLPQLIFDTINKTYYSIQVINNRCVRHKLGFDMPGNAEFSYALTGEVFSAKHGWSLSLNQYSKPNFPARLMFQYLAILDSQRHLFIAQQDLWTNFHPNQHDVNIDLVAHVNKHLVTKAMIDSELSVTDVDIAKIQDIAIERIKVISDQADPVYLLINSLEIAEPLEFCATILILVQHYQLTMDEITNYNILPHFVQHYGNDDTITRSMICWLTLFANNIPELAEVFFAITKSLTDIIQSLYGDNESHSSEQERTRQQLITQVLAQNAYTLTITIENINKLCAHFGWGFNKIILKWMSDKDEAGNTEWHRLPLDQMIAIADNFMLCNNGVFRVAVADGMGQRNNEYVTAWHRLPDQQVMKYLRLLGNEKIFHWICHDFSTRYKYGVTVWQKFSVEQIIECIKLFTKSTDNEKELSIMLIAWLNNIWITDSILLVPEMSSLLAKLFYDSHIYEFHLPDIAATFHDDSEFADMVLSTRCNHYDNEIKLRNFIHDNLPNQLIALDLLVTPKASSYVTKKDIDPIIFYYKYFLLPQLNRVSLLGACSLPNDMPVFVPMITASMQHLIILCERARSDFCLSWSKLVSMRAVSINQEDIATTYVFNTISNFFYNHPTVKPIKQTESNDQAKVWPCRFGIHGSVTNKPSILLSLSTQTVVS